MFTKILKAISMFMEESVANKLMCLQITIIHFGEKKIYIEIKKYRKQKERWSWVFPFHKVS